MEALQLSCSDKALPPSPLQYETGSGPRWKGTSWSLCGTPLWSSCTTVHKHTLADGRADSTHSALCLSPIASSVSLAFCFLFCCSVSDGGKALLGTGVSSRWRPLHSSVQGGDVHRGGRQVLPCGAGSGIGPPPHGGHHIPGPQARKVRPGCVPPGLRLACVAVGKDRVVHCDFVLARLTNHCRSDRASVHWPGTPLLTP